MKADHRQPPARCQQHQSCRDGVAKLLQLLVEVNPYSLKGACGRVLARLARGDSVCDKLGKIQRGRDGPLAAARCNRLCNAQSKPFFAISRNDLP